MNAIDHKAEHPSADHTARLNRINTRAQKHAYDIDDIDWSMGCDPQRWAFPEDQMPLSYTAAWGLLNPDEQRQASQWYACAVSEQFIFLEMAFLAPAVVGLLRAPWVKRDVALREALEVFLQEEQKHGEMFRRLLLAAAPHLYKGYEGRASLVGQVRPREVRHFYTPGPLGTRLAGLAVELPELSVAWPWLGMILEEKTIAYHRAFQAAKANADVDGVTSDRGAPDPLHHAVHRFHFLDEARHVQLEALLIERLWDTASPLLQAINRPLLFSALGQYTRPRKKSVSANIVRALVAKFPRLVPLESQLLRGLLALKHDAAFQRQIYGHQAIPQTFQALCARPELHGIEVVAPDFHDVKRAMAHSGEVPCPAT
jgi:hypothetical protein